MLNLDFPENVENYEPSKPGPWKQIGMCPRGFGVYVRDGVVGNREYRTDELSCLYLDTALHDIETMKQIIQIEEESQKKELLNNADGRK